jgi:hypothetical protein
MTGDSTPAARRSESALAVVASVCAVLCSGCAQPVAAQDTHRTSKEIPVIQQSRSAPARLPPVEIDGVRYEQVMNGLRIGMPARCGYLSATNVKSGERLWVIRVYEVTYDEQLERDVQDVYFTRMHAMPGGKLEIENEAGDKFVVDLAGRSAQPL